jgi:indolepyruvate ferredoxin oxidoreductase alpha subunit
MKQLIIGNQAVAYGALAAGVEVAAGYPGTPSSEALTELLHFAQGGGPAPYVEWSTNEKVAFELATGAAWTGKRAMATMKMSGANVAADSILSVAYSGTTGGLVVYIADDPGAEAGMPEQDSRLFAQWAGLPVLEAPTPARAFVLTRYAFELSEACELPVVLRLVTSVAHAREEVDAQAAWAPLGRSPRFDRDIFRYTKAGAAICLAQHRDLLARLGRAQAAVQGKGLNRLQLQGSPGGPGVIVAGSLIPYLNEALPGSPDVSVLALESPYPLDEQAVRRLLTHSGGILILEELEPFVEMLVRSLATRLRFQGTIIGKLDGLLPRVGKYGQEELRTGLSALRAALRGAGEAAGIHGAVDASTAQALRPASPNLEAKVAEPAGEPSPPAVKHPITFCAGCPHRGTYMALNRAIKKSGLEKDKTVVTGDIGCTILGMNPPFHSCWTEVSMGSSIGLAQGFLRAGMPAPVVATIGDSTFFHAGIPPLINAVQHRADLLLLILDNGWTSMTGFQVNPGTAERFQSSGSRRVEIEAIVRSLGVDSLELIRPFQQEQAVAILSKALRATGVRVIISQQECALTAGRRERPAQIYAIDPAKCTFCRSCLRETGCPALYVSIAPDAKKGGGQTKNVTAIDPELCTGCGLCYTCCRFDAISRHSETGGQARR